MFEKTFFMLNDIFFPTDSDISIIQNFILDLNYTSSVKMEVDSFILLYYAHDSTSFLWFASLWIIKEIKRKREVYIQ